MPVKQIVTHNERGPTPFLLVTSLGVKAERDEIAFLRHMRWHLPRLLSDRRAEAHFFSSIILRNARDEFSKVILRLGNFLDHDLLVADDNFNFVAQPNLG